MSQASSEARPADDGGNVVPGPGAIELSIVMPCLDEAETLETCINKALGYMERDGVAGEIIVADNGSTDGSQDIARRLGARVVDIPRRGYGAALQGGIAAARGKYVIMGDSDDSYDFSRLELFVERLRAGDELVMGNRFAGGIAPGAMPPLHKYVGNPFFTIAGKVLFGCKINDSQCGLRGFDREVMQGVGLRADGMEFASEMVVKSTLTGLKIGEVPTTLSPDGRSRAPHLRSFRDGWRILRFLLMHNPRFLFFIPGALMIAFGLLVFALVLPGAREMFGVNFDVHSLVVGGASIVLGTQAVTFGLLAKQFGTNQGLLPPSPGLERFKSFWTVDRALRVGLVVTVLGLGALVYAVIDWRSKGLGDLDYTRTMRIVIPAVTGMMVGVQLMLSAFMSGILDLKVGRG